jgi:hypothetical protein
MRGVFVFGAKPGNGSGTIGGMIGERDLDDLAVFSGALFSTSFVLSFRP